MSSQRFDSNALPVFRAVFCSYRAPKRPAGVHFFHRRFRRHVIVSLQGYGSAMFALGIEQPRSSMNVKIVLLSHAFFH